MNALIRRLAHDDDGQHMVVYAFWLGLGTAVVEPYLIIAALYRLQDLALLFETQVRILLW